MRHLWRPLVVLAGAAWLTACCGEKSVTGDSGSVDISDPITAAGDAAVTGGPDWGLPAVDVPGGDGDIVLAVSPIGDSWGVVGWKAGELMAVSGTKATFLSAFTTEQPNTPGALMVPVPYDPKLKVGDIVMGDVNATCRLARIEKIDGDTLITRTVWVGEPTEIEMTIGKNVAKAPAGLKPLGIAVYPEGDGKYLGEIAHVGAETTWLISQAGTIKQAPTTKVLPVNPYKKYKVGNEVYATWGDGRYYPAKITKVLDGGLQYEVDYDSDNPALAGNEVKAFWEIAKSIQPGTKFTGHDGDEDTTPAPTYGVGEPVKRGGRSDGGRTSMPVARPKR